MKLDSRSAWKMMHSILLKRQTLSPEAPKHEKKEEEEQDEHFWLKTQCLIVNKFLQVCASFSLHISLTSNNNHLLLFTIM